MAGHLHAAITAVKLRVHTTLPIEIDVDALARDVGHAWRQRTLTPAVTLWLFMLQVLNGNCAISALRHVSGLATAASSYCTARARLPVELFTRLFDCVCNAANLLRQQWDAGPCGATLLQGRRVLLADATTFSTPDTPALRDQFGYPPGQRQGCGFPVGRLLGVIDAISGCVMMALGCPLFTHEAREMLTLHPSLKRGDIIVADRGFCSFAQIVLLARHGVDAVLRLHQRRSVRAGNDWIETWTKPKQRPHWMSEALWQSLPQERTVRIVRYSVNRKNCRTRHVYIVTTLLDSIAYPREAIMRLYGHRWNIETCFNQLKTHAKMNTLKSQSTDGVIKELIMYLIVWNLVRMMMLQFAQRAQVSVWRVSFIDTIRGLSARLQSPARDELKMLINPHRPDRWEPRKIKRRLKEYDLLMEPRQLLKSKHRARYA